MNVGKWLLGKGNGKLGEGIHTWSLPAWSTCPGRSAACTHCYALSGNFIRPNVKERATSNLGAAQRADFAERISAELKRRKVKVVRIHVAGDFFSATYAAAWRTIAAGAQTVRFYCYTRSWRIPEIADELRQLAELRNVRLWYSADADTGIPTDLASGARVAYLQTAPTAPVGADLIFRVQGLRAAPARRIGLTVVCPVENGSGKPTTCSACKVCWR